MAYYAIEPWGDDWQQAAMVGSLVSHGPLKKPLKQRDLMPGKRQAKQTSDEMFADEAVRQRS